MANRNVFEFFHSNDVDFIASDGGYMMVYHGLHQSSRMYVVGSVVKEVIGSVMSLYIAIRNTDTFPNSLDGWDLISSDSTVVARQVVSGDGLTIVSADGFNIKTY